VTSEPADAIVLVHPLLAPISAREIEDALGPEVPRPAAIFELAEPTLELRDLADVDWPRLAADLAARTAELQRSGHATVRYFGLAPIPLAIELGRRLGSTRRVHAYQRRHDTRSWRWPSDEPTLTARLDGVPDAVSLAKGDVAVRVSCSYAVSIDDVRRVVPYPIGELSIEIDRPHDDALASEADVTTVATLFGSALDAIARCYPNCDTIHLFAAVPCALALRLGTEIQPNVHARPIQTYQFVAGRAPRYWRALVLGERPRPELTHEQRTVAHVARGVFAASLGALRDLADVASDSETWLSDLVGPASARLPNALARLGPLGRNRTIVGSTVSERSDVGGEFRWDADARAWTLDDRLLLALATRVSERDLAIAGRLFFLHEAIHIAKQGITTATVGKIGRLPRVLEEIDYLADLWALVYEHALAVRAGESPRGADVLADRARVMTQTLWAFDAGHVPRTTMPIRRLNRYLIWHWLRLGLETVDDLDAALEILGTKPVLEVSGPRVRMVDSRVVFDLDPAGYDDLELGVLVDGFRVVRIGSRAGTEVQALLEAVRMGDEVAFTAVLRGVFDTTR
jgi:hypothetical protein